MAISGCRGLSDSHRRSWFLWRGNNKKGNIETEVSLGRAGSIQGAGRGLSVGCRAPGGWVGMRGAGQLYPQTLQVQSFAVLLVG